MKTKKSEKTVSEKVSHEFPPVYDERSRVLILGSIPSPRSRAAGFYYMHPQNRFWKTVCAVLGEEVPESAGERRELCLRRNIALWDVLESCYIEGASDSSIKNAVPNDLKRIFAECDIRAVFTTGKKANAFYRRFFPDLMSDTCLPSTSPANRTITEAEILEEYRAIAKALEK